MFSVLVLQSRHRGLYNNLARPRGLSSSRGGLLCDAHTGTGRTVLPLWGHRIARAPEAICIWKACAYGGELSSAPWISDICTVSTMDTLSLSRAGLIPRCVADELPVQVWSARCICCETRVLFVTRSRVGSGTSAVATCLTSFFSLKSDRGEKT